MAKKLWSIFTKEDKCLVTGAVTNLEHHHVFGGRIGLKPLSERYGFICPLHSSCHPNGSANRDKNWVDLDHWLKRKCQEYYIEVAHYGDRDDWYREFGRFYDDRTDENVWLNREPFEWDIRSDE